MTTTQNLLAPAVTREASAYLKSNSVEISVSNVLGNLRSRMAQGRSSGGNSYNVEEGYIVSDYFSETSEPLRHTKYTSLDKVHREWNRVGDIGHGCRPDDMVPCTSLSAHGCVSTGSCNDADSRVSSGSYADGAPF